MLDRTAACSSARILTTFDTVLVFRALKLGDMLCAVPALRALRRFLPSAKITLAGLPWAARFAARFGAYVDEFIPFPGHPGLPEQHGDPFRFRKFRQEMRVRSFGLAVQMHGSGAITNEIVMSLGGRISTGFHPPEQASPDPEWFAPYPANLPEVERNLALLAYLGVPSLGSDLEFPILHEDERELALSGLSGTVRAGTYVCIHPGASRRDKCWPVEEFAAVSQALRKKGMTVVVTGDRGEADLARSICGALKGKCIDAASHNLGLGALALLIRGSRLLVCNDTGVSHLAAALRVPSIVIFGQADPLRWAPLDRAFHRPLGGSGLPPSVDEVLAEAEGLLSR